MPTAVRAEVVERDASCCRVCGRYTDTPALHHVRYRSQGGENDPANLVVVGWTPGHDCHLGVAHADKGLWQPVLLLAAQTPGVTGYQIIRWMGLNT